MNILLLGSKSILLKDFIISSNHNVTIINDKLDNIYNYDFIISFGYRYKINENIINKYKDKIINLHISLLPYNKGADPNLWSFLLNTPKGVTIHKMAKDIDNGDILLQKEVVFNENETLKSSYDKLIIEIVELFKNNMSKLLSSSIIGYPQEKKLNTYHYKKDKLKYEYLYKDLEYDTPVKNLIGKGL